MEAVPLQTHKMMKQGRLRLEKINTEYKRPTWKI